MPPPKKRQITLGVLMLWIAVCSVYCLNLKIVMIDQAENIKLIWESYLR